MCTAHVRIAIYVWLLSSMCNVRVESNALRMGKLQPLYRFKLNVMILVLPKYIHFVTIWDYCPIKTACRQYIVGKVDVSHIVDNR